MKKMRHIFQLLMLHYLLDKGYVHEPTVVAFFIQCEYIDDSMRVAYEFVLSLKFVLIFVLQLEEIFCQYRTDVVVLGITQGPGYARVANEGKYTKYYVRVYNV